MTDILSESREEERRSARLLDFDLSTHRRPFATATELAAFLDVDPRVIVRMIHAGSLEAVKVGRSWRIPTDAARAAFHVERKQAS